MTRTGQAAIDYARSRVGGTMPQSGLCLQFVRQCFDVPSYYYSAIDAWNAARARHPGDRNPPPAVPLYFATPSVYDHVVFAVSPDEIITTFNADIRRYTGDAIGGIERDFNGSYLGWAEDLNRVTVYVPDTTDTIAPPEVEMPTAVLYRHPDGSIGLASDDGSFIPLVSTDEVNAMLFAGPQVVDGGGVLQTWELPDGFVWNLRTAIASRKAAQSSSDPAKVAGALAPLLVPPIVDTLGQAYGIPDDEIVAAVRDVIADLVGG